MEKKYFRLYVKLLLVTFGIAGAFYAALTNGTKILEACKKLKYKLSRRHYACPERCFEEE